MKKLFKGLLILALVFVLLIAGAASVAYMMFPPSKLKAMGQEYVKKNFGRDVDFDSLSFNFIGATLNDFTLSEAFPEQGKEVFVSAKRAVIKVEFKPLFEKRIEIKTVGFEDLKINIIKHKDGAFNFDDIIENAAKLAGDEAPAPVTAADRAAAPAAVAFVADNIFIKNATVNYKDLGADMQFSVREFNFNIARFDLTNPFDFEGSFATDVSLPDLKLSPVLFTFAGTGNLADMVLKNASLEVKTFEAAYKNFKTSLSGTVKDFDNPAADFKGFITGVDSKLASEFVADLPEFALPKINLSLSTLTNLQGGSTKVNEAKISIGNSYVRTTADVNYSQPELKFNSSTKISVSLKEVGDMAKETLAAFKLAGNINGNITAASAKDMPAVKGSIELKDIGAVVLEKELKNFNGVITINSLSDIKSNLMKGVFDGGAFSVSFAYSQPAKAINADFFFDLEKFTLDDINFDALMPQKMTKEEKAAAKAAEKAAKEAAKNAPKKEYEPIVCQKCERSAPMNIKADVAVHKIANNVFDTNAFKLKVNIKDLDNKFDKAAGTITFSTVNGEIKDIEKLMQSSVIFKIALTSVHVAQQAFSKLNLGSANLNTDSITYSSIEGDFTLKGGVVTINKTNLNADLTTVKTTGTVNLLTEKLDMRIESHIGKMGSSGFKPVVIKVGGTINEPTYKLDVTSTLTNVLSGGSKSTGDAKADVKANVENAVQGVKDLFKKK